MEQSDWLILVINPLSEQNLSIYTDLFFSITCTGGHHRCSSQRLVKSF